MAAVLKSEILLTLHLSSEESWELEIPGSTGCNAQSLSYWKAQLELGRKRLIVKQ